MNFLQHMLVTKADVLVLVYILDSCQVQGRQQFLLGINAYQAFHATQREQYR
jgi:hypothetical protein